MACRCAKPFVALLLQVSVALGLAIPALAQAVLSPNAGAISDFAVAGVTVQRSGDMTTLDREQVLAEGQGIALRQLLRQLLAPEIDPDRVMPRAAEIAGLVEGYDIEQENSAANRYTALVTYRFRPAAIRALVQSAMQNRGAPSAGPANPIRARVFLSGLEEWIEVRKRLAAIPVLLSAATVGLNRTEAVVELVAAGSIDQVTAALARRDLVLEAIEDGYAIHVQGLPVSAKPAPEPPAAASSEAAMTPAVMPATPATPAIEPLEIVDRTGETPPATGDIPPPRLFAPRPGSPSQPRS